MTLEIRERQLRDESLVMRYPTREYQIDQPSEMPLVSLPVRCAPTLFNHETENDLKQSLDGSIHISAINTIVLKRQHDWRQGEGFWFWGLIALSASYMGFGLSVWLGRPALAVANLGLLLAYLAMSLQLRYWRSGKTDISIWLFALVIVYTVSLELLRQYLPYTVRLYLIHSVMTIITAHLFWSVIQFYRTTQSTQLIVLATTFAIEFLCASSRLIFTLVYPESTNAQITLYEEPLTMVVLRWVWLLANAMSYLTVMTYELEKTLNKTKPCRYYSKRRVFFLTHSQASTAARTQRPSVEAFLMN